MRPHGPRVEPDRKDLQPEGVLAVKAHILFWRCDAVLWLWVTSTATSGRVVRERTSGRRDGHEKADAQGRASA